MEFIRTRKVSANMIGSDSCLSVIGVFGIVQDAITEFMGELKVDGLTVKRNYNAFWVFVRSRVKLFKGLLWNDEYTVRAFISSKSLAKIHIDVKVSDSSGDAALYARVELCVLDIASQRIKKIESVGVNETMPVEPATTEIVFGKFDCLALTPIEQIKVRSTNIDGSHHTNNLEYIRFIMNTYPVNELEAKAVKEMEVVYVGQSYENDVLDVLKAEYDGKDYVVLQKGGKPIIKCEIVY